MQVLITAPDPFPPQVHGPRLLRYSRDGLRDNTIYTTLPPPSQHNPFTVAVSIAIDYADGFGCGCDGEPAFFELRAPPWAPPPINVPNTTLGLNSTNATVTTAALHLTEGAVVGASPNGSALDDSAVVGAPGSLRCIARPSNQMHASAHHGASPPVPTGASRAHPIRQTRARRRPICPRCRRPTPS